MNRIDTAHADWEAAQAQREFWWFMLFAFVVIAIGIGLRSPWPADEPRFVLVAKQMWESGEWLFPHRGRELYPDKPPVYFWLLNAAYSLVRDWNWAFLLPSLFAALGTLALVADLGRRLWNPRAGLWAAAAVLCAVQFVYQAKRAQIDPTVVFLIMLGCYGLLRHLLLGPHWHWFRAGCFAAGLGVATKGVGFLPLLLLLPWWLMRWRNWNGLATMPARSSMQWASGAIAFFAGIGLWFVPMLVVALGSGNPEHRAYLDDILFRQTATRYVSAWHHHEPFWYFAEVIALFWLPFSLALPWLLRPWRDAWRERMAPVWLPLAWVLLVLLFFSASPGKRDMYILPALPMLALAAASFLPEVLARRGLRIALIGFVVVLGAVLGIAGSMALFGDPAFEARFELARDLIDSTSADRIWLSLALIGLTMLAAAAWFRVQLAATAVAVATLALWSGYGVGIAPVLDADSSGRELMEEARVLAGPATAIGLVHWTEQMMLQAQGPVTEFGFKATLVDQWREGVAWLREEPSQRRLLTQGDSLAYCATSPQRVGTANRRDWWLVDAASVDHCPVEFTEADLPPPGSPD